MKIGLDGKRATRNTTGLGNYSRLVIEAMSEFYPVDDYTVYYPGGTITDRAQSLLNIPGVEFVGPDTAVGRRLSSLWRVGFIVGQLRRDRVELFHGLSNELPLSIGRFGGPSVVTVHDVIFRHCPEYYKPIDRKIYDFKLRRAVKAATRIIAVSRYTAQDLTRLYGVDPSKIDVIYQGCDEQFHCDVPDYEIDIVKAKYGIKRRYILGVGTIERRKNQLLSLRALKMLPGDIALVLVGRRTSYCAEIEKFAADNGLSDRLIILDRTDFTDFPGLYAGAEVSVYPSRIEGFGIPVVESFAVGTPAVVATGSCLEEAAGEKAVAVDPDDAAALAEACRRLIDDRRWRREVAAAGMKHARSLTKERMAREIMATYRRSVAQCVEKTNS